VRRGARDDLAVGCATAVAALATSTSGRGVPRRTNAPASNTQ
jgi:hypothetical protein